MVGNSEHVSGWGDLGCVFAIQQPSRLMLLAHPSCANKTWKRMDDAKLKFYTGKKMFFFLICLILIFFEQFHLCLDTCKSWHNEPQICIILWSFSWENELHVMVLQNKFCNFSLIKKRWNHHKSFEHRAAAPLTFWVPDIFQAWNQNLIMKYGPPH